MNSLKAALACCVTVLIGLGATITYLSQQERYALFSQEKAVFVFDKKNATLNYCTPESCQLIMPNTENSDVQAVMGGVPTQMAVVASPQQGLCQTGMAVAQPSNLPAVPQNPSSLQIAPQVPMAAAPAGMQPQQMAMIAAPGLVQNGLVMNTSSKDAAKPAKDAKANKSSKDKTATNAKDDDSEDSDSDSDSDNNDDDADSDDNNDSDDDN